MSFREHQGVYLASNVIVTGNVVLATGVNLWYGTIIRGDIAQIKLETNANIQDGCILHTDFGVDLLIEEGVVAGHGAIIHGSRVGRNTLIGIGARILSGTLIGEESIIASGSVVVEGAVIPPRSVVMGIPGKVVRQATDEDIAKTISINQRYLELARSYTRNEIVFPYD